MGTPTTERRRDRDYQRMLVRARDRFVESGGDDAESLSRDVMSPILDSWRRSSRIGVDPARLTVAHSPTAELDVATVGAADRVLAHYAEQLSGEPVSLVFAARSGQILRLHCHHDGLKAMLDKVSLGPGCRYGETDVGTNGIGTCVETATATLVIGDEHYNEELSQFACAGAPVLHPVTGATLGVVDLTCRTGDANFLLLATARTVAEAIQARLFEESRPTEIALLRDYLAACRSSNSPILAVNDDVLMINRAAQHGLAPRDRADILSLAADSVGETAPNSVMTDLPSGLVARLDYRPSYLASDVVGGIFKIQLSETSRSAPAHPRPRVHLPGLTGTSLPWHRVADQVAEHRTHRTRLIVEGEAGVGKLALCRATHHSTGRSEHLRIIDAEDIVDLDEWLEDVAWELGRGEGTLVLRHLDGLPEEVIGPLSEILVQSKDSPPAGDGQWVVATRRTGQHSTRLDGVIVPCFERTVTLPPLRHRPEDIEPLAEAMLRRLVRHDDLTLSPAALRQLQRLPWTGNATQLYDVLGTVVRHKRRGRIEPADLPALCHSTSRRSLSRLEAMERDAIVEALRQYSGRKDAAAAGLGMSRATMYRKIKQYDIQSTG